VAIEIQKDIKNPYSDKQDTIQGTNSTSFRKLSEEKTVVPTQIHTLKLNSE